MKSLQSFALAALASLVFGCVSEEGAERRWSNFGGEHNGCETLDDCAVVYPGCPLGCWDAVATEHVDDANAKAEEIIKSYERGGRSCAYSCLAAPPLVCDDGTCGFGERDENPCSEKMCGESCSNCVGEPCPDVEETCNADGFCVATQPVCE